MAPAYPITIAAQSRQIGEVLATGDHRAPVPGCPAWTLAELGFHLAQVQGWAALVVESGTVRDTAELAAAPEDPAEALAAATAALLAALDGCDPGDDCWNFTTGPQKKSFWFRRQALEAAVHRWDAQAAIDDHPDPFEPDLAVDIIDEFLTLMLARTLTREKIEIGPMEGGLNVRCTDRDRRWSLTVVDGALVTTTGPSADPGPENSTVDATIEGTANDLALFLYNRTGADAITMSGDASTSGRWMAVLDRD